MTSKDSEVVLEYTNRRCIEDYIIKNQKYLYRIAFSYVKNKDDALEIVQNTIYKSISSSRLIRDLNLIKPWITRILINSCFDFLKKRCKSIVNDEVFDSVEDNNACILDKIILKNALDNLPLKLKTIIILRFFEDFKIKDISNILDMKENTVKTNLYKALKILKINLEEEGISV